MRCMPLGVGGALAAAIRPATRGTVAAAVFLAVGLAARAAFAPGRFGADVGAAIVFPAGGRRGGCALRLGARRGAAGASLVAVVARWPR